MKNKLLPRLAFVLLTAELLLLLVSWLLSAMPSLEVRSLLSGEGVRWLSGRLSDSLATPLLVWILLLGMGYGTLRRSGLLSSASNIRRNRIALWGVGVVLLVFVAVVILLTAVPHAIMLSVTGHLFPSPFSAALVPMLAFGLFLVSVVYGTLSGRFATLSDVYESLLTGLRSTVVFLLFYLLLAQLYFTARFAFTLYLPPL